MSSPIVKWAVAALLALPAIPLFAQTTSSSLNRPAIRLSASTSRHTRRYHHRTRKHTAFTAHTRKHHRLSHTRRHLKVSSMSAAARPVLHLTHTPPTIDGIRS